MAEQLPNTTESKDKDQWEREIVHKLALSAITEQRRARRWGIFFKLLTFLYLFILLVLWLPDKWPTTAITTEQHTALVDIQGIIIDQGDSSADNIVSGLRKAFEDDKTKGVIIRINSPGGSPVQAGYVYDEIKRLREKYPDIPLYAVIADVCASGGYYIAAAADEIYANKASIVGSIGVLMNGFGFVDTLKYLGIERRLLTAGERKGLLDPFSPAKQEDMQHIQGILNRIHQQFIDVVKKGRGNRLNDQPDLYSGLIWTGEEGKKIGLVDGIGSSSFVARELIGAEKIENFTAESTLIERLADRIGAIIGTTLARSLANLASIGEVGLR